MARRLLGAWLLARPGNGAMAAAGVAAGGLVATTGSPDWGSLGAAAASAFLGVAGGNALNDYFDAEIDWHAHPQRPIPRGDLTRNQAATLGGAFFVAAILVAAWCNPHAFALAALLVGVLLFYEFRLKAQGVLGNFTVAAVVGATLPLGALAARGSLRDYLGSPDLVVWNPQGVLAALLLGLLAFLANAARELFKDVQDEEFDRAWRRTLPHRLGAEASLRLARSLLWISIPLAFTPTLLDLVPREYLFLVAPSLLVFVGATLFDDAGRAAWLTKMGMILALVAFLTTGLL